MEDILIREMISVINGLVVQLIKINENLESHENCILNLTEQVDELGTEIYKFRQDFKDRV